MGDLMYDYTVSNTSLNIFHILKRFWSPIFVTLSSSVRKSKVTFFHQVVNFVIYLYFILTILPRILLGNFFIHTFLNSVNNFLLGLFMVTTLPIWKATPERVFNFIFNANLRINQIILIGTLIIIVRRQSFNSLLNENDI